MLAARESEVQKENAEVTTRIDRVVSSGVLIVDSDSADGAVGENGGARQVENNTWIVGDDEEVIVIDPAHDAAAVLDAVGDRVVLAVICTHGHSDHIAAAVEVAERDEAYIALHPADQLEWRELHPGAKPDIDMADGGIFEVAEVRLEVLHTPGHSRGSVCVYCEDLGVVFSGDTLLKGRPGPHGDDYADFAGQLTSIGENLLTLPGGTRVLPGHGEETTIEAEEKRFDSWVASGPAALVTDT
jgi:glyoxylase-like metal-dependent hydrolase (beta-lactamase superfamily II)